MVFSHHGMVGDKKVFLVPAAAVICINYSGIRYVRNVCQIYIMVHSYCGTGEYLIDIRQTMPHIYYRNTLCNVTTNIMQYSDEQENPCSSRK